MATATRSASYITTITNLDDPIVAQYRSFFKMLNKFEKESGNVEFKYRLVIRGRLGKDNPAAGNYKFSGYKNADLKSIRLKDAARYDLYVGKVFN